MKYLRRRLDDYLDEVFPALPAIAIDGARGVGKTETARRRVAAVFRLDEAESARLLAAGGRSVLESEPSVLLDEWQKYPVVWDWTRRMVDDHAPTAILLTGSATPRVGAASHSGAGRIVSVLMRPMSLTERGAAPGGLRLTDLFAGASGYTAESPLGLTDYVEEITASGLPGIRGLPPRLRRIQLDSYITRIVDRDLEEQGALLRRAQTLRNWMRAYAAASSTTASYTAILNAATAGLTDKPARSTTENYRDLLSQIRVLDPVPAWTAALPPMPRLKVAPKHQLVDPAIAARLLGLNARGLLGGIPGAGESLGQLFESLATLCVRADAISVDATVGHLRTRNGDHEVDLVVDDPEARVVGIEVKLAREVEDRDVRHLCWLRDRIGERFAAGVVLTTGPYAYQRPDGIWVVPLALFG